MRRPGLENISVGWALSNGFWRLEALDEALTDLSVVWADVRLKAIQLLNEQTSGSMLRAREDDNVKKRSVDQVFEAGQSHSSRIKSESQDTVKATIHPNAVDIHWICEDTQSLQSSQRQSTRLIFHTVL
nr:hypothetical protein CFP56_74303 [Quercus suber]